MQEYLATGFQNGAFNYSKYVILICQAIYLRISFWVLLLTGWQSGKIACSRIHFKTFWYGIALSTILIFIVVTTVYMLHVTTSAALSVIFETRIIIPWYCDSEFPPVPIRGDGVTGLAIGLISGENEFSLSLLYDQKFQVLVLSFTISWYSRLKLSSHGRNQLNLSQSSCLGSTMMIYHKFLCQETDSSYSIGPNCCLGSTTIELNNGWDGTTSFKNLLHWQQGL